MSSTEPGNAAPNRQRLPDEGLSRSQIATLLAERSADNVDWKGRMAAGVNYFISDEVVEVSKEAYLQFFSTNPLYKDYFPGLAQMESDIVDYAADIFNGPLATGSVTSGGSESILMAVKSARDRGRSPGPR